MYRLSSWFWTGRYGSVLLVCAVALGVGILVRCGGEGGGGEPGQFRAVDPYIVGAQFCVDTNKDDICNTDEPLSTLTDTLGYFSFDQRPEVDSRLVINPERRGTDNGRPFTLNISRTVDSAAVLSVTPATTLLVNGCTPQELIDLFALGSLVLTEADLRANPMERVSQLIAGNPINDSDLASIRANIVLNAFLRVLYINNGDADPKITCQLINSDSVKKGVFLQQISTINTILTPTLISSVNETIQSAPAFLTLPPVSAEVIVRTALIINDWLVPLIADKLSTFNVPDYLSQYGAYVGKKVYVWVNKDHVGVTGGISFEVLPDFRNCSYIEIQQSDPYVDNGHPGSAADDDVKCIP